MNFKLPDMAETGSAKSDLPVFDLPALQHNECGNCLKPVCGLSDFSCCEFFTGWGPCELPDAFKDMPYQPFSKSDRMGKISDWTGTTQTDKKYNSK